MPRLNHGRHALLAIAGLAAFLGSYACKGRDRADARSDDTTRVTTSTGGTVDSPNSYDNPSTTEATSSTSKSPGADFSATGRTPSTSKTEASVSGSTTTRTGNARASATIRRRNIDNSSARIERTAQPDTAKSGLAAIAADTTLAGGSISSRTPVIPGDTMLTRMERAREQMRVGTDSAVDSVAASLKATPEPLKPRADSLSASAKLGIPTESSGVARVDTAGQRTYISTPSTPATPANPTTPTTTTTPAEPAAAVAPADTNRPRGDTALSDAEIVLVLKTANTSDSTAGEVARSRGENAAVRQFGETMIQEHGRLNALVAELERRAAFTPQASERVRHMQHRASEHLNELRGKTGAEFDRDYIDRKIDDHQKMMEELDKLIPAADNAELRALLVQARAAAESHLNQARQIRSSLR